LAPLLELASNILLSSQIVIDVVVRMKPQGISGDLRAKATPKRTMKSHAIVNARPASKAVMRRDLLGVLTEAAACTASTNGKLTTKSIK
jgi:hypothetical protein